MPCAVDVDDLFCTMLNTLFLLQSASSEPSKAVIIHFHGGGFLAQTSQSHVLGHWKQMGVLCCHHAPSISPLP